MTTKHRKTRESESAKPISLVIDESVSSDQTEAFERFAATRRMVFDKQLRLAESHPGISDDLVIHHLLGPRTVLLTTDRPFHNKVLTAGLRSFHLDKQGRFLGAKLKGIKASPVTVLHSGTREVKDDYRVPKSELRTLLLPDTDKALKKIRTKRRRIRNHFGGMDNIDEVAITVSVLGEMVGIRIRISALTGHTALDATEAYIRHPNPDITIAAPCYGLTYALRLMLQSVRTTLYFDAGCMPNPDNDNDALWSRLRQEFPRLTLVECTKGPIIDRLRGKLAQLPKNSNEPVGGDLGLIGSRVLAVRC